MALPVAVVALVAADQAVKALGDGIQQVGNGPLYLRDGEPQSIPGKIGQEVARSACRRYAEGDFARLSPNAAAGYEVACRPYLDAIDYGNGGSISVPFRGGQCYGDIYLFDFTATDLQGNRPTTARQTEGRLIGTEVRVNSNGNPVAGYNRQLSPSSPIDFIGLQIGNPGADLNPVISNVRRASGQPDNCGNPEIIVTDPIPPPTEDPNPKPFKPSPDIDIDIDVTLNVDGSINFNIGVGVPILIRPSFDFSPDADGDGDDGGGGGEPPSPPAPEPGPELPGGNGGFGGDDGFGEPPAGRRWVGCCIRLTAYPLNQPPIPGSIPEDVFPQVVGNIRLVFNAAGNRQTDTPVRITAKHVCVWEPVAKLNPVGVNVDLLPGFGYVYTPYSVPIE